MSTLHVGEEVLILAWEIGNDFGQRQIDRSQLPQNMLSKYDVALTIHVMP